MYIHTSSFLPSHLSLKHVHVLILNYFMCTGYSWASAAQSSRLSTLYDVGGIVGGATAGMISVSGCALHVSFGVGVYPDSLLVVVADESH